MPSRRPGRVAVIGAGVSGVVTAAHLLKEGLEVTVYERSNAAGGNWLYDERKSIEPSYPSVLASKAETHMADQVAQRSPCYIGLKNNVTTPLLETTLNPFPKGTPDIVSHSVLKDYIQDTSAKTGVEVSTRYNTEVKKLSKSGGKWTVNSLTLTGKNSGTVRQENSDEFDSVVVASGHYHTARVPDIPGLADWKRQWPERVQHSKGYKSPEDYKGKNFLLIGGGVSSMDIARELSPFANVIYQSHRNGAFDLPASFIPDNAVRVDEVDSFGETLSSSPATSLDDDGAIPATVTLKSGRKLCEIHHVIVCTGYHISLPFLNHLHSDDTPAERAGDTLLVTDGLQLHNLHKDIFYIQDPSLVFVGVPYFTATFTLFEFQAMVVAKVLSGQAKLPSQAAMRTEYQQRVEAKGYGKAFHSLRDREVEYVNDIIGFVNSDLEGSGVPRLEGHTAIWHKAKAEQKAKMKLMSEGIQPAERESRFPIILFLCPHNLSPSSPLPIQTSEELEKREHKWYYYLWDTLDKPKEERWFMFKVDAALLTFASLGKILLPINWIPKDLQLYQNQLNYMQMCWTVGYVIGQLPSNIILTKFRPSRWIPTMEVLWTILTFALCRANSARQIYILRFFVGLAESTFYPGMQYIIGSWYRKEELAKRSCIFHTSGAIASMFSGYLMAAVYHLDGRGGFRGWQWLFIVDGVISLPIALAGYFVLPDVPEISKPFYLTEKERQYAIERMKLEGRKEREPYTRPKIIKIFSSWHIYLLTPLYVFFNNGGMGGQPVFQQFLKASKNPKYTVAQINTYPTATGGVQIITTFAYAWASDSVLRGARWPPIILGGLVNIMCSTSLAIWDIPLRWKWACYILSGFGNGLSGLCMAWAHEICTHDNEERAIVIAFMNEFAYVLQAWLPLIVWQQIEAPQYRKGFITITFLSFALIVTALVIRVLHARELAKAGSSKSQEAITDDESSVDRGVSKGADALVKL
ncbi:MFS general substrate transporter [Pleomassaria siparia CBS 279.74]|uniref:MFS general substrate transporter n=1 Tax=Pleomassaria siparia CBS 279.74 TaxID=1314801 RepID=A0A6G1K3T6_9PLEO|nr:MFS general substrate transporter [Pleomassaria siparia CBS 279.74]